MKLPNDCEWSNMTPALKIYHDTEWGVPLHDDQKLFEFLILDIFQAGLSWNTILNKRDNFRIAFDYFDWKKIALYTQKDIDKLINNKGIIRNKQKILSAINNAKSFEKIVIEYTSFDNYIWSFVDHKPIVNMFKSTKEIPAITDLAIEISNDLKKRGFKFVGPTIIYAFMQSVGLVNDHIISCKRHFQIDQY